MITQLTSAISAATKSAGVVVAALFVVALIALVNWVIKSGVAA